MAGTGATVSSAHGAVVKVMRVMLPAMVVLAGFALSPPARGATAEIVIPVESIIRGPEGTIALLATVAVDPDLQGSECTVTGVGVNQDSIHPNTDILVSSGGGQVVLPDVEREPNFVIVAAGTLVLGPDIVVEVRFGPDRVFSGGLDVVLTCTTPPPEGSVSVVSGVCVPETNVTPVVVVIDPASSATVTVEGPGGPFVVSGGGGTVEVGPGDFTWSAVAADGVVLVGVTSGSFSTVDCTEEPPVDPPAICDAAMGDRVWFDTNADGVQQPNEVGVSAVLVELLSDGQVVATTSTDAAGLYGFTDLCAGSYQVRFLMPDIPAFDNETWTVAGVGDDGSDSDADSNGLTAVFELNPGDNDLTWDAGVFAVSVAPTQITPPPAQAELPMTGASSSDLALVAVGLIAAGAWIARRGAMPGH